MNSLLPLPVTVYAASLALSVSYQQLRYCKLSSDQDEAYHDFTAACVILEALQGKWSAADAMASLGRRIATELEKTQNLAILRVDRRGDRSGDAPGANVQGLDQDAWVTRPATVASHNDREGDATRAEVLDLFGEMDDISWMYLDAENPISFDCLPWIGSDLGPPE